MEARRQPWVSPLRQGWPASPRGPFVPLLPQHMTPQLALSRVFWRATPSPHACKAIVTGAMFPVFVAVFPETGSRYVVPADLETSSSGIYLPPLPCCFFIGSHRFPPNCGLETEFTNSGGQPSRGRYAHRETDCPRHLHKSTHGKAKEKNKHKLPTELSFALSRYTGFSS